MKNTCTRSDLIAALQTHCPQLPRGQAETIVRTLLEQMGQALAAGRRIEIRDFGSFSLHHRAGRMGHNPRNGRRVEIAGKWGVYFRPGKALKALSPPPDSPASQPAQAGDMDYSENIP